jgi:hypothetical protein
MRFAGVRQRAGSSRNADQRAATPINENEVAHYASRSSHSESESALSIPRRPRCGRGHCEIEGHNTMIIATYNVENLFARAKALEPSMDSDVTAKTLAAHAEINDHFNKLTYDQATQKRIVELLETLDLLTDDESDLVILRIIRGKLLTRHKNGTVDVVATGRAD